MNSKLSIIIPCYNCSKTLEEAVDSCYKQGLDIDSFEIILVDDKSKDATVDVFNILRDKYKNIKCFYHDTNMGGGATRNTAVKNSSFDYIFCLDSDDVLEQNTLSKMLNLLINKNSDGIAFSGAYSFSKNKEKNKKIDFKLPTDKPIVLDYLFSGKAWIGGNFMYTKKAFNITGGYPIDHNFDTQAYGFKFLANNLTAYPCPETFLYQRQFAEQESYFERAYNSGEFSLGHYLTFIQYINVFSENIQKIILDYDIFIKNTLQKNILVDLQNEYKKNPDNFFSKNKSEWTKSNPELEYQKENYKNALDLILSIDKTYKNKNFDIMRYALATVNKKKITIKDYSDFVKIYSIKVSGYNNLRPSILERISRKIKSLI